MLRAHLFSSNWKFIKVVEQKFQLAKIFFEEEKMSVELHDYLEFNQLDWISLKNLPTGEACGIFDGADLGLSFGFGRIFQKEHIAHFGLGIWNIHPGELPKYRGKHPITHAFLNGDRDITVTVHQIDEEIDRGNLIASGRIRREFRDSEQEIIAKTVDLLDFSLLENSVKNFFNSRLRPIKSSKYLKNYNDGVEFENPILVSREMIYNASLSQKSHGGITISGRRFQHVHFYSALCPYPEHSTVIRCKDGLVVAY